MLLQLTLSNYRSFKDPSCLNFETRYSEEHKEQIIKVLVAGKKTNILKSIIVTGSNSSGKSNFIKGFAIMKKLILNASNETAFSFPIKVEPFRNNTETIHAPSTFQICLLINSRTYLYEFSVHNNLISSEMLTRKIKKKEETLFVRTNGTIEINKNLPSILRQQLNLLKGLTLNEDLYLSVLYRFNVDFAQAICGWFKNSTILSDQNYNQVIAQLNHFLEDHIFSERFHEVLPKLNLGFQQLKNSHNRQESLIENVEFQKCNSLEKYQNLFSNHLLFNSHGTPTDHIMLDFVKDESLGTQKIIAVLAAILDSMLKGGILWVDDMDSKIPTWIQSLFIALYSNKELNVNDAQIVCMMSSYSQIAELQRNQIIQLTNRIKNGTQVSLTKGAEVITKHKFLQLA